MRTNLLTSMLVATLLAAASALAAAQNVTAPAREAPRPQDIDPAVDTSAVTPARETASSSRETPRPQDVEPRVNTSAGVQLPAGSQSSAVSSDDASKAASPASPQTANGAAARPGAGKALDRLELDTTQITGNRELPKVLYIVPWKRSDLGDLVGKPINSLLDEVLMPVDRDVFQRENRYYRALTPGAAQNDALSAAEGGSAARPGNASANGGSASGDSAASSRRGER
jgi:hypothetical protein